MTAQIHPTADVEAGATVGHGSRIWRNVHIRAEASLGAHCVVGGGAYVDAGVEIGDRVKIENNAMLFSPARVGDGAFIGPGACLSNDPRPRAVTPEGEVKGHSDWGPEGVVIGEGASLGSMTVVLPGVAVGAWAMVGAAATVTRDIPAHALAVGNPARQIGWVCRCGLRLGDSLVCMCGRAYERSGQGLRPA